MSRKIQKELRINNEGGQVFDALTTPSLVKQWRGASQAIIIPDEDGVYALTWGNDLDKPEYVSTAKISEFKPHVKLVLQDYTYLAHNEQLHFKTRFQVKFEITCHTHFCILNLTHLGFPDNHDADDFYKRMEKSWEENLLKLKQLLEKKQTHKKELNY